jgi:hypothetical protein
MASAMTQPYRIVAMDEFPQQDKVEVLRKELIDFQKCVKGNPQRLLALCDIGAIDGHQLDSECCQPVSAITCQAVMREAVLKIATGMSVDGKDGNWSCGFLGSRWFDLDASDYGCAYIRCAFYSRKHFNDKASDKEAVWPCDKPYMLRITIEKTA